MNWDTDWKRADAMMAYHWPFVVSKRKTFKVRAAALALIAWTLQWSWLAWWYWTAGRGL